MEIIELLSHIFKQYPWLFFVGEALFFVLTIIGVIVQSCYEPDYKIK